MRQKTANFLAFFTSLGTLVCCALPALFVALGAGAAVASTIFALPWLGALSAHKEWVFLVGGLMIAVNFILVYRPRSKAACMVGGGTACEEATQFNKILLWISASLLGIGLFMALAMPHCWPDTPSNNGIGRVKPSG